MESEVFTLFTTELNDFDFVLSVDCKVSRRKFINVDLA